MVAGGRSGCVTVHDVLLNAKLALGLADPAASGIRLGCGYILRGPVEFGLLLHALLRLKVVLLLLALRLLLLVLVVLVRLASAGGRRARIVRRFLFLGFRLRRAGLGLANHHQEWV